MTQARGNGRKKASVEPTRYRQRTYRQRIQAGSRVPFQVVCQETDLMIQADALLEIEAREHVLALRSQIEGYIADHPGFATSLVPWPSGQPASAIIRRMIAAGTAAGVGPMAAVAGAVAESVGRRLLNDSRQVVVENGGDIFIRTDESIVAAIFAGASPLSMKVGIRVPATAAGLGMCTSSASVGHSLSRGKADAVCVISADTALADAAATAVGNRVKHRRDIQTAIEFARSISGIMGIVVIIGREMGAWGAVELLPLPGKKG